MQPAANTRDLLLLKRRQLLQETLPLAQPARKRLVDGKDRASKRTLNDGSGESGAVPALPGLLRPAGLGHEARSC